MPCFIFLWVGSAEGLELGRELFKIWNFRRCEDVTWIKNNSKIHNNENQAWNMPNEGLFQRLKEHCLVGIRGTVKRGQDGHFLNANVDTDMIITEMEPEGSTKKPEEIYSIIEHFCLGRKRIELFARPHNIRSGWVSIGSEIKNTNWDKNK